MNKYRSKSITDFSGRFDKRQREGSNYPHPKLVNPHQRDVGFNPREGDGRSNLPHATANRTTTQSKEQKYNRINKWTDSNLVNTAP